MKTFQKSLFVAFALFATINIKAQNIFPSTGAAGIGTTSPNASSLLDITSTSKGLLIPRMTKTQRDAIAAPATGLLIYQTNSTPGFYYFDGSAWQPVSSKGVNKTLSNLSAPTAINTDMLPNANGTMNIGSSVLGWKSLYLSGSIYSNDTRFISKDETNTWVGLYSGLSNTGSYNNAFGYSALYSNTSGSSNTAIGYNTLFANSTGSNNIAIGQAALYSNTIGSGNVAAGFGALYLNTTGSYNNAYGYQALFHNTTGSSNIATGNTALYSNTDGIQNTAYGNSSLYYNTTGYNNTANGYQALYSNTIGSFNTVNGYQVLYNNTTGYYNTASGSNALFFNTAGENNTANGSVALYSNTTGSYNTANGASALFSNTTGDQNTANGYQALSLNTTGYYNSAHGSGALFFNTTGFGNIANGYRALYDNSTGYDNTGDGYQALYSNITGYYNTALGFDANVSGGNLSNAMALGAHAIVNASGKAVIGDYAVTVIGGHVGWSILSDGRFKTNIKENVPGLEFIKKLRPVTYNIDELKFAKFIGVKDSLLNAQKDSYSKASQKLRTGFVAQEVEETAQQINYDFDGINHPQNDKDNYSLVYADFVPSLVKAVQELSKNNDEKDSEINSLNEKVDKLQSQLNALIQKLNGGNSVTQTTVNDVSITNTNARLEQNVPNPANGNTTIKYYVPLNTSNASIMITDMNGHTLKSVMLNNKGAGKINISSTSFVPGNYFYSLMIDGKKIVTKQMMLAH